MDETHNDDERFEAIGKLLSTIFLALLAALFAYGYLGRWLFG
jgi:hypothetical protein